MKFLAVALAVYIIWRISKRKSKPVAREEHGEPPQFTSVLVPDPKDPRQLVERAVKSGGLKPPIRIK